MAGKVNLIEKLAERLDIPKITAKTIVETVFDEIREQASAGEKVTIKGFATFYTKTFAPRAYKLKGRDINVPERKVAKCRFLCKL